MEFADRSLSGYALRCALNSAGFPDLRLDRSPSLPLHPRILSGWRAMRLPDDILGGSLAARITAHAIRAFLLASATAATLGVCVPASRGPTASCVVRLRVCRNTGTAPAQAGSVCICRRACWSPQPFLAAAEFCRGVIPSQAANSRPDRNRDGSVTVAAIALAPMMPMPGMVASNWLTWLCRCHLASGARSPGPGPSCRSVVHDDLQDRSRQLRQPLLFMAIVLIKISTWCSPCGAMMPNSAM